MPEEVSKISKEELAAFLAAAEFHDLAKDEDFLAYLLGFIEQTELAASPVLYESILQSLTVSADAGTLAAAEAIAEREAETLITNMVETEIKKVGQVIKTGIENGWHPSKTAKYLDNVKGLDSVRAKQYIKYVEYLENLDPPLSAAEIQRRSESQFNKLLDDRKEVIAQTETRFATSKGNYLTAKQLNYQFKAWITAGDNRVSPACASNEDAGYIRVDDNFPAGSDHPPQHPRCRCTLVYRLTNPDQPAILRQEERAKSTQAALAAEE